MNTIITIGRQHGSRGREIGQRLAQRLEVPFYDKERLREVATDSGFQEVLRDYGDRHAGSLLLSLATGAYSFGYHDAGPDQAISQKLYLLAFDMVRHVARQGPCVIVGRCADYVLKNNPACRSVFIHAPMGTRVQAVSARLELDEAAAEAKVRETDRLRRSYYNYYTTKNWGEVDSYHLCVDSSVLGVEETADLLANLLARYTPPQEEGNVIHLTNRVASV